MMPLTRRQIKGMAGDIVFQRGEEYYRTGMVRGMTNEERLVRADVQGSERRPYQVTVALGNGYPVVRCSCPFDWGNICKHGVAVLLSLLERGQAVGNGYGSGAGSTVERTERDDDPAAAPDPSFEAFLMSSYESPRLELGLTVKGLQSVSSKGIPFTLSLCHGGSASAIQMADLDSVFSGNFPSAGGRLPALAFLSPAQRHLLNLGRGFIYEPAGYYSTSWRIKPFQLSMLLDHISREKDIDIAEVKSSRKFPLIQEPLIGLRVVVRATRKDKIGVGAALVDPLNPGRQWHLGDLFAASRLWLFDEEAPAFRLLDSRIDYRFLAYFLGAERILELGERRHFLAGVLPKLREFAQVILDDPKAHALRVERHAPRPVFEIDAGKDDLTVAVAFDYGGRRVNYNGGGADIYLEHGAGDDRVLVRRDIAAEDNIIDEFVGNGRCVFDARAGVFRVNGEEDMFEFLSVDVPSLQGRGDVFLSQRAKTLYGGGPAVRPRVRVFSSGIDWFACEVSLSRAGENIDISGKLLRECLAVGRRYTRLKNGEFVKLDAGAFDRVSGLLADQDRPGHLMPAHVPFVIDELRAEGIEVDADPQARKLYDDLKNFRGLEPVTLPPVLEGVLRDYQKHGINWLAFLKKFRFGGILADEMGLGKTLQALTMIFDSRRQDNGLPSLVVCPTSLVWNWEAEVRKFFPDARALVISGKDRAALMEEIPRAQIVMTSYALLRRDIKEYHKHRFHYLVLDEAQNIKNRHTINARVAKQLNAEYRLALSGTPLENSIADIWSIFDFLMPSFLGRYERFRGVYEVPITRDQDNKKLAELSRRVMPFVLRRLKADVIKELPEKIEQTSFCELEPAQAKIYAALAKTARVQALEACRAKGFERSRMFILTLLLRLRQICCHPELAGARLNHRIGVSAKTDLLKEMLSELIPSGHRVLIFSQFVAMLEIIRDHLKREKISFEYMDGRTQDRRARVERFNTDPSVKVFLLSLKTGGLGLNLPSADTVILYEPWWNPAVEQQAIDRAHRMGQKNAVLAYRLIARGTIEEKILELQRRKKFLMNSLVLSEESAAKKLGWEDIKFLLDLKE